ncbi:MAG: FHA domain-containing protein, partial [Wenzhouxiangella sp.]|nr:FHA domain-containing protein [Wenzhouxiangella sp.]
MKITLTVEQSPDPSLQGASMSFDRAGGTLGRAAGNDWVLPDPNFYTSGRHAEIRLENDRFVVVDLSTNGTFHNSPDQLIGKHRSAPLTNGDRLYIGEFVMKVGLEQAEATAQAAASPADEDDDLLLPDDGEPLAAPLDAPDPVAAVEKDEFDDLLEGPNQEQEADQSLADDELPFASRRRGSQELDDELDEASGAEEPTDSGRLSQSPEREYFAPPDLRREAQADEIPDEWDALLTGFFEPPGSARPKDSDQTESASQTESGRQAEPAQSAREAGPTPAPDLER